jgi:hypothetical protein
MGTSKGVRHCRWVLARECATADGYLQESVLLQMGTCKRVCHCRWVLARKCVTGDGYLQESVPLQMGTCKRVCHCRWVLARECATADGYLQGSVLLEMGTCKGVCYCRWVLAILRLKTTVRKLFNTKRKTSHSQNDFHSHRSECRMGFYMCSLEFIWQILTSMQKSKFKYLTSS